MPTPNDRPPSVDAVARSLDDVDLPHPLRVDAARDAIAAGEPGDARRRAEEIRRALLGPVINATGVLLHTNLGRAPIDVTTSGQATNLEIDMSTGHRGSRSGHVAGLLARACGAPAALVVNNGAAAVLLALAALARRRSVVVSRGELVEIGGGFRVPEVMAESGAALVEVGTTNRTRIEDYRRAVESDDGGAPPVAAVLKVHRSNYRIVGFTEEVATRELSRLGPPMIADIGSGLLDAACPWLEKGPPSWLRHEPAARQTLEEGAALVTFSGDKLLGGPQAGIIAGRAELVATCARHPLARALRPGGLVLAELQATVLSYLRRDGDAVPFWRMASVPVEVLAERAEKVATGTSWSVTPTVAVPGGGSLPGVEVPSVGVTRAGDFRAALRARPTPIIARVADDRTVLDLRSVDPAGDEAIAAALAAIP